MDRERARQEIRQAIPCQNYLEKSKSGLYNCPFCGSGTGAHGTGALKVYDTNTFTCHACNKSGDVIDLYRNQTGADYNTALNELASSLGITIDSYRPSAAADFADRRKKDAQKRPQSDFNAQGNITTPIKEKSAQEGTESKIEAQADFSDYYKACRARLNDPAAVEYLKSRCISLQTAAAYWIGFDPEADPAIAPGATGNEYKAHPCPRIIIPTSRSHYVARRIDGKTDFEKMNPKGATPGIFNENTLYTQEVQEIFITEGAFDALSVLEAGHTAIAINSAENAEAFIKKLEQRRTAATLIISLDNDQKGEKAKEVLRQGLQRLNIAYITADISGKYKDANEALQNDTGAFLEALEVAKERATKKPDNTALYIKDLMQEEIKRLKDDTKTGFNNLDKKAGGLYSGLYVLAAISSLGKTSFALQLADQLAASGKEVIFFSLEQSRLELVSKSLARRTAQQDIENAVTSLAIRKGYAPQIVKDAITQYTQEVQDRISIVEGNFNCDISFIGDYIRHYTKRNNTRPIVFIDYLQILQPAESNQRQSLKENIDHSVTELKRLSRELDLTIFIISSVNRANYLTPIDFESLKESGGIEFTADVIWGLQLQCLNEELFDKQNKIREKRERIKEAKAENPREIELVCLKNRYGIANFSCYFDYYPANDLFEETITAEEFGGKNALEWNDEISD